MRESKVEKDIWQYAEATGWFVAKVVSPGKRGMPDRVFIKDGVTLWGEIKAPDEEARRQQQVRIRDMRKAGALVFVWDNYDTARRTLDDYRLL